MIDIKICKAGNTLSFCAIGHADHAPYGYDIVCAGVSGLVIGLSSALDSDNIHTDISSGRAVIRSKNTRDARCCFRLVQKALELIAAEYPENIKLTADLI
ncbi:MAG: ribosomal-processing cysteine protease Prp [Clostridia bacterium]|nr:ribosomal-processing cysteine protease Prp [Clostridia bacterium]